MTQPNTVDMTFDTSLVDLHPSPSFAAVNTSFSTTESDPTSDFTPSHQQPSSATTKPSTPVHHIPTQHAYDQWASVYDTDGNMLQAIDDLELQTLLPTFLAWITSTNNSANLSVLDLGCGTGRNTLKLVSYPWPRQHGVVNITGLDFSQPMLEVAAKKLAPIAKASGSLLRLQCCECFPTTSSPLVSPLPAVDGLNKQDAVVSTLVLEHIPLSAFFSTLSSLLVLRGCALVSNMHADMGRRSQAGFVNADGVKVRGSSYVYTVQESLHAAVEAGFEVVSVHEREMRREDVESGMVGERGRKWIGTKVWYAVVLRMVS